MTEDASRRHLMQRIRTFKELPGSTNRVGGEEKTIKNK